MWESRAPPPFNEEPQISKDFWGFFVFLPADLFLLRWVSSSLLFFIGFYGWIGRQSCLSDYSRISADIWPLANGSRQKWAPLFLSRRFRRWRRFFLIDYLSPTDFTDLHRFFSLIIFLMDLHGFSLIFFFFLSFLLFFCHFFISQILDLSVWDTFHRLFSQIIFFQILWKISLVFFFHLFVFCL